MANKATINSVADFNDEQNPVVKYYNPSVREVRSLQLCIMSNENDTYFASYRDVPIIDYGIYTFSLSDAERKSLRQAAAVVNGGKLKVRFRIKTQFNSADTYYYSDNVATMTVINATPSIVFSVEDADLEMRELTGGQDLDSGLPILVPGYSDMKVSVIATAQKERTIEKISVSNGGKTIEQEYDQAASNYIVLEDIQTNNLSIKVIDSAGGSNEVNTTVDLIPYVPLTCNIDVSDTVHDESTDATETYFLVSGTYYNGYLGRTPNTLNASFRYRINDEAWTDWYSTSVSKVAEGYTISSIVITADYRALIELEVNVNDALTSHIKTYTTQTIPVYDWSEEDFNFNVPVTIQGGSVPTIVEQALNNSGWSYRKWSDGTAECWRTLSVTTAVSTATNASWYSSGELSSTNLSFPFTFAARPSVTVQTMPTGQSWAIVFPSNTTGSTTKTGSYQLNSMSSTTSRAHLLSYDVKGRWK